MSDFRKDTYIAPLMEEAVLETESLVAESSLENPEQGGHWGWN